MNNGEGDAYPPNVDFFCFVFTLPLNGAINKFKGYEAELWTALHSIMITYGTTSNVGFNKIKLYSLHIYSMLEQQTVWTIEIEIYSTDWYEVIFFAIWPLERPFSGTGVLLKT